MRVAVRHQDEEHSNHHWFAFRQGRILGYTDPMSNTAYTAEQVADALLAAAQQEFPEAEGYEHRIETLHTAQERDESGAEQGEWHPVGQSELPRIGEGHVAAEHVLDTQQGQETSE